MTIDSLRDAVGREVGVTEWHTISQERIDLFAEASGDRQWIHVDAARAQTDSPYGATIAHGFLMLSMLSQLSRDVLRVEDSGMRLNYGVNRVRFPSAVTAGSRVRARFRVESVKPFEAGVDVTLTATMEVEGSAKPCCVAEWILRYYASTTPEGEG